LSAPLLSGFSIDELFRGLIFHQDKPLVGPAASFIILILLAILSLLLVIGIIKTAVPDHYKMLVIVFYAVAFLFFSFVFLKQSTISYEGRHLRVLGLVIIPGAVCFFAKQKRVFITLLMISWLGISLNSVLYLGNGYIFNKIHGVRGNTGLAQEFIDQPSLNAVIKLDNQYNNAIFAFISPDLGLEIQHNRIITLAPIGNDLQLDYDEFLHDGHAGPIFIVLPKSYAGTKAEIVFKCFPGYKNFFAKDLSTAYTLYSAF
jgi:hypothetical protein